MTRPHAPSPIVVGIDGSDAAVAAARWAAEEAVARDVPLRLIHAADVAAVPSGPGECFGRHLTHAEPMLRAAQAAVAATGKTVKVETGVVTAGPRAGLITDPPGSHDHCTRHSARRRHRYQQLLQPWVNMAMDTVIAINPEIVTGVRIVDDNTK